jgi:hypothetical protein
MLSECQCRAILKYSARSALILVVMSYCEMSAGRFQSSALGAATGLSISAHTAIKTYQN